MKSKIKPLDIVRTPLGDIALVTEVNNDGSASISYLRGCYSGREKNAWWSPGDGLVLLDSVPRLLACAMAHPFGSNAKQGDRFFTIDRGG